MRSKALLRDRKCSDIGVRPSTAADWQRPLLLTAVGRKTEHAGQSHLLITCMHVAKERAIAMLTCVHALLVRIKATTAQLLPAQRWAMIANEIVSQILARKPNPVPYPAPIFSG